MSSVLQESLKQNFKGVSNILYEFLFVLQFLFCKDLIAATRAEGGLVFDRRINVSFFNDIFFDKLQAIHFSLFNWFWYFLVSF